jgi:hypothetical protein
MPWCGCMLGPLTPHTTSKDNTHIYSNSKLLGSAHADFYKGVCLQVKRIKHSAATLDYTRKSSTTLRTMCRLVPLSWKEAFLTFHVQLRKENSVLSS